MRKVKYFIGAVAHAIENSNLYFHVRRRREVGMIIDDATIFRLVFSESAPAVEDHYCPVLVNTGQPVFGVYINQPLSVGTLVQARSFKFRGNGISSGDEGSE